jgi:hypothetical protein
MQNIIVLAALIAVAASLIWLGVRAWRVKNGFLKWGGMGVAATLALAAASVGALTIVGMVKQHARSSVSLRNRNTLHLSLFGARRICVKPTRA